MLRAPDSTDAGSGPLWSVMIPTYESDEFLEQALACVLAQDEGPARMQIEVIDDHSVHSDPETVVRRMGGGRVSFFRQARNVGHARNFQTCVYRAQGQLVHLLHADDRVRPGFYQALAPAFDRDGVGAAFCRQAYIGEGSEVRGASPELQPQAGIVPDALGSLVSRPYVQASAVVVRRDVLNDVGGYDPRFSVCGEDWELLVRIAARYAVWYEPAMLAEYRSTSGSLTAQSLTDRRYLADLRLAIGVAAGHFPVQRAAELERRARTYFARVALFAARQSWSQGQVATALDQMADALRFRPSVRVVPQLLATILAAGRCAGTALIRR